MERVVHSVPSRQAWRQYEASYLKLAYSIRQEERRAATSERRQNMAAAYDSSI